MDVVGCGQFDGDAGDDIGEEDSAFWNVRADEVECRGQKYDVEDVVYEACGCCG